MLSRVIKCRRETLECTGQEEESQKLKMMLFVLVLGLLAQALKGFQQGRDMTDTRQN